MNKFNGLLITLVAFISPAFAAMPTVENIQQKEATLSVQASSRSVGIDVEVVCGVSSCLSQLYNDNDGLFNVTVTPTSDDATTKVALSFDPAVNPGNWGDGFIASNAEGQSLRFKLVQDDGTENNDASEIWFPYDKPGVGTWHAGTKGDQFIYPGTYKITVVGGVWHA